MAKLGQPRLRSSRRDNFARGKHERRRRDGKLRKSAFFPPRERYANFISGLKGTRSIRFNRDRVLNWWACATRAHSRERVKTLFAKPWSREMHVKRRIIRSLIPDYHALSWRTCGRTTRLRARAKRNEIIISASFFASCNSDDSPVLLSILGK